MPQPTSVALPTVSSTHKVKTVPSVNQIAIFALPTKALERKILTKRCLGRVGDVQIGTGAATASAAALEVELADRHLAAVDLVGQRTVSGAGVTRATEPAATDGAGGRVVEAGAAGFAFGARAAAEFGEEKTVLRRSLVKAPVLRRDDGKVSST